MQAVVAIPEIISLVCNKKASELIMPPVAGVPLLMRTLITASRAAADDILLIRPAALSNELVRKFLETALPGEADAGKVHRSVRASDHYPISFELRLPG